MAVLAYAPINYYTNERFTDEVELRKVVLVPFMRCALVFESKHAPHDPITQDRDVKVD